MGIEINVPFLLNSLHYFQVIFIHLKHVKTSVTGMPIGKPIGKFKFNF